jgi:hypothetical protein
MAEKLSDKLKGLFKRADTYLGRAVDKVPKSTTAMKKALKPTAMMKAVKSKLPSAAEFASATKKAGKFGKLRAVGRVASRVALPVAAGFEAANIAYKVATLSPEKKAKIKKLKTELSKKSTKQSHADLLKMSTGGDTMLKNPKKADLDKDGKLSGYEKKRAKAIESNMKQKPIKAVAGIAAMGLLGAKMLSDKKKKKAIKAVSPVAMLADVTKEEKNQVTTGQQKARKGKMMKAYKGDMAKGYGAARTQGQGLQDENLIPGKSLDYYKDIM